MTLSESLHGHTIAKKYTVVRLRVISDTIMGGTSEKRADSTEKANTTVKADGTEKANSAEKVNTTVKTNSTEKANATVKANSIGKTLAGIVIIVAVLVLASLYMFRKVSDAIISINISSMEEMASHDMNSVMNNLEMRWKVMTALINDIQFRDYDSFEDLIDELSDGDDFVDCKLLALTGDDGKVYRSTGVIGLESDKGLYDEVIKYDDKFAVRFDYTSGASFETSGEYILIGLPIKPFTVQGVSFDHVFAMTPIKSVENEMIVDSYDGQGTGYIINQEGYYVVNINRSSNFTVRDNFFDKINDARIEGYASVDELKADIAAGVSPISTELIFDDATYIAVFQKMDYSQWYYISYVPRDIFSRQAGDILIIFGIVAAVMLITVAAAAARYIVIQREQIRTEQSYRKQLSDALYMAQQANRAKTTFLNNMSHDIRTPMNAVIGFAALATTHADDVQTVRSYLQKITKSSEHLLSLINDVLDMSRIESGKVNISEKPEELSDILHSLRDMFQSDIHAKRLNFYMDTVDVQDEYIICDRLRLNQVLLNMVSNAVKYTPPGGTISLRVIQKKISKSGYALYEFRVRDNGIGMSEEFVKTVFEPFTREESSTINGIQGTGLGMAITSNIVRMMGGTISVESKLHEGSEFTVTLEFKLAENGKARSQRIVELDCLRALVVDDDINTCQSLSDMLRNTGMRPEWCTSGREGVVRAAEAHRIGDAFAVCIIDWLMPDMNGIETTRQIRKTVGDDIPIVILTSYDWKDIEEEAKEAGVTRFMNKPLFPSELHHVLMEVCGNAEEEAEAGSENEAKQEYGFEGSRILVAEDNDLNCEIAVEILHELGCEAETAENGQVCIDMLESAAAGYYDLILMDIQMPIMDGYRAAAAIRAMDDAAKAAIPIIALSANTFEEDKRAAREAGMNGHIGKPIQIPVLIEELQKILVK